MAELWFPRVRALLWLHPHPEACRLLFCTGTSFQFCEGDGASRAPCPPYDFQLNRNILSNFLVTYEISKPSKKKGCSNKPGAAAVVPVVASSGAGSRAPSVEGQCGTLDAAGGRWAGCRVQPRAGQRAGVPVLVVMGTGKEGPPPSLIHGRDLSHLTGAAGWPLLMPPSPWLCAHLPQGAR